MMKSVPSEPYTVGRVVYKASPHPKKKFIKWHFFAMGPCLSLPYHLFYLSHHKTRRAMPMNYLGLKIVIFGTLIFIVTMPFFFLGVNQSGPETTSTTNQRSYMALGLLRGAWCKPPLTLPRHHKALPDQFKRRAVKSPLLCKWFRG